MSNAFPNSVGVVWACSERNSWSLKTSCTSLGISSVLCSILFDSKPSSGTIEPRKSVAQLTMTGKSYAFSMNRGNLYLCGAFLFSLRV